MQDATLEKGNVLKADKQKLQNMLAKFITEGTTPTPQDVFNLMADFNQTIFTNTDIQTNLSTAYTNFYESLRTVLNTAIAANDAAFAALQDPVETPPEG